jgi:uncharacterized protein YdhG (YjbR/CyaY superfamily)
MPAGTSPRSQATDPRAQVRAYLAAQPPVARRALKKVREIVRATAPGAEEGFSYRMPAFRLDGKVLVWYAGWKEHFSLYPITPPIVRAMGRDLAGYETSKGTMRFPLDRPVPVTLIRRLVKARGAELKKPARK